MRPVSGNPQLLRPVILNRYPTPVLKYLARKHHQT